MHREGAARTPRRSVQAVPPPRRYKHGLRHVRHVRKRFREKHHHHHHHHHVWSNGVGRPAVERIASHRLVRGKGKCPCESGAALAVDKAKRPARPIDLPRTAVRARAARGACTARVQRGRDVGLYRQSPPRRYKHALRHVRHPPPRRYKHGLRHVRHVRKRFREKHHHHHVWSNGVGRPAVERIASHRLVRGNVGASA